MYNSENNQIYEKVTSLAAKAEAEISSVFARIDEISYKNTQKVLRSFAEHRVSESMFAASSKASGSASSIYCFIRNTPIAPGICGKMYTQ